MTRAFSFDGATGGRRRPWAFVIGVVFSGALVFVTPLHAADSVAGSDDSEGILATLGELILDGGVLMIPIAIASIIMLALALERIIALRRSKIVPSGVWSTVQGQLEQGRIDLARKEVDAEHFPVSRMLNSGLLFWESNLEELSRALDEAGQREADRLQKNLPALQGIASVAPLLGLLGTVVGMIQSFFTVAKERALGNPALLADGIGQALVTTAAGLTVAIPALVLFYAFRGRARRLVGELDDIARGVLVAHRRRSAA